MAVNELPDAARAKGADQASSGDGAWITPSVSYINPQRRFCALCGRPIARRYWRAQSDGEGKELVYCDPAHAALHTTYPAKIDGRS